MRDPSFPNGFNSSSKSKSGSGQKSGSLQQKLNRVFNTALVASKASKVSDTTAELERVFQTPAFRSILKAVNQLALDEGISEQEAASQIIQAFRRVDEVWSHYLLQEGIDRLKTHSDSDSRDTDA